MIEIGIPRIEERGANARISVPLLLRGVQETLWFETSRTYGSMLVEERADGFVVALLQLALEMGEDIRSAAPVSERLHYGLSKYLIPALSTRIESYHPIRILAETRDEPLPCMGWVATGMSCGVDSFATVVEHASEDCPPHHRLTHLTLFNVGSHGDHGGQRARDLFLLRLERARAVADAYGIPLIPLDSNLSEILHQEFLATSTLRSLSAALILQKAFRCYDFSSSYALEDFRIAKESAALYDIFTLPAASTETLTFFSTGSTLSRLEKIERLARDEMARRFLNVCVASNDNCSECHKCSRTMVALDVLGFLDEFAAVFDVARYERERHKYLAWQIVLSKRNEFSREIVARIRKTCMSLPWRIYPYVVFYTLLSLRRRHG